MLKLANDSGLDAGAGKFVTVAGGRLHYVEAGAGRPVVLLHGNAGFVQDYAAVMQALPARGFHAIAFDRPGHGLSERPSGASMTMVAQASLLHDALDALGIVRPVIVGHSWSGALVLAYALEYQRAVAALVLLAPAVYPEPPAYGAESALLGVPMLSDLLIKLSVARISREIERSLVRAFAPDPVPVAYLQAAQATWQQATQVKATVEDELNFSPTTQALSPRYSTMRVPTLVVTGDADQLVNPVRHAYPLHRVLPQAELIVLPATGHMLPQTRMQAVLATIAQAHAQAARVS